MPTHLFLLPPVLPSGYNAGMDEKECERPTTAASAAMCLKVSGWLLAAIALYAIAGILWIIAPLFTGAMLGSIVVFVIVRCANRRDDPHIARRPPDAP